MLCPSCHRQLESAAGWCRFCGASVAGGQPALELVLRDRSRVPVVAEMTIGRAEDCTVRLADPSVSRHHARIVGSEDGTGTYIEDTGSSYGTFLDGGPVRAPQRLRDGSRIRLGDQELVVERRRDDAQAGHTMVVPGQDLVVPRDGAAGIPPPGAPAVLRPGLRPGCTMKRLEAGEGSRRFVIKSPDGSTYVRLSEHDGQLVELLDGEHELADLVGEAELRFGPLGAARVARLLADLGERGLLSGIAAAERRDAGASGLRRLLRPRERAFAGSGRWLDELYRRGGWLLFTRGALVAIAVVASCGVVAFTWLLLGRYGTPFVVARHIGLGGLVFVLGRLVVVTFHELAHGLTMASFGRRVRRAGLKLILVFPYAFVDTSEAWFEPRRRRIAISAAGPLSDLALGGLFAITCLLLPGGTLRDIVFQLALAAYLGACFNLNPFLDRDGYHMLVDLLREPRLRERARAQLQRRLSGAGGGDDDPALTRYALAALIWSVIAVGFVVVLSLHYAPLMRQFASGPVVWGVLGAVWVALLVPTVVAVVRPLLARRAWTG